MARLKERVARYRQLDADEQRFQSAQQHESEAGEQVQDADVLVVNGGKPAQRARRPQLFDGRRRIR